MKTSWTNPLAPGRRGSCCTATAALCALGLLSGCTSPMGARRAPAAAVYEQLNQSALTGPVASAEARSVLARHGLSKAFETKPEDALARLHRIACADSRQDTVFALAELSYLQAEQLRTSLVRSRRARAPDCYLSSAIYAYLFLVAAEDTDSARGFDRRTRLACELYNRALADAFADGRRTADSLDLSDGVRETAPGAVRVTVSAQDPELAPPNVETYLPANRLLVHGLSVRNRTSGIGAPLVFCARGATEAHRVRWRPATAMLRVAGSLSDWSQGTMAATLELHAPGETLDLAGDPVPMEADTTAPIAQALSNKQLWGLGRLQFLTGQEIVPTGIYTMEPYRPGRIPVLFVHGTMSSPVRWAEMWNTLMADPVLQERYQFWNFVYASGNPLAISIGKLRDAVQEVTAELDPNGNDPALRQMVVIGHSQGGLLTRMTVTDTGDTLWRLASDQDFDTLEMTAEQRAELQRTIFYTPLPQVKRVVFIATPHRGSYRASLLAQSLAQRFVTLPGNVLRTSLAVAKLPLRYLPGEAGSAPLPNSIIGMSPNNPYLHAVAEMPFPADVRAHSIIAIKDDSEPPAGNDGVVAYQSAHLDQVDSEFIVRSKHSCQAQAATIEEVRRILMVHLGESAQ
jgi:pimeloyl-ACP methyl ester carboxylesterase